MKLILISGARGSKKDLLASRLAGNSDCIWIKPYSNRKVPVNADPVDDRFIKLNDKQLNRKLEKEVPIAETIINGNRYIFFENQLRADYCVIIGDDRVIFNLKNNWDGDIVTVKCHSRDEQSSPRFLLDDTEFDIVYNYDEDDYDTFEAMII